VAEAEGKTRMSATVADVALSFNLLTLTVDVHTSVASDRGGTGLSNFCKGKVGGVAHDPAKIVQVYRCPATVTVDGEPKPCGNEDKTSFVKGRKEGKNWVMVSDDKVEEAASVADKYTKGMTFAARKAGDIEAAMIPIDAPYYLAPKSLAGTPGNLYALFAQWVANNPDVALITRFAPRSAVATFRLQSRDGVLMLQKLCFPEDLQAAPAAPSVTDSRYAAQLDEVFRSNIEAFDPEEWMDERKAILGSADGQLVSGSAEGETATIVDLAELLKLSTKGKTTMRKAASRKKSTPAA